MRIEGNDGPAVSLRPVGWQFPPDVGAWDDQWLVVSGTVDLGDRTWSFSESCLLMPEARALATWLREVAEGRVEPDPTARPDGESSLSFVEPLLGFTVTARAGDESVVRVQFAAEATPPWLRDDEHHYSAGYAVELRLRADRLLAAAEAWTHELDALPGRSFASTD